MKKTSLLPIAASLTLLLSASPAFAQDPSVRVADLGAKPSDRDLQARRSLAAMGDRALPSVVKVLQEKEAWERKSSAAWVLGEIGNQDAMKPLAKAWKDKGAPPFYRMQVAMAMAELGDHKPLTWFLRATAKDQVLIAKAATALANQDRSEAVPAIKAHWDKKDIRPFLALALGRLGDKTGEDQLKPLLRNKMFRDHAAVALAKLGDKTVIFQLRFALNNPDPYVKRDAIEALGRMDDVESLDAIKRAGRVPIDRRLKRSLEIAVKRLEREKRRIR